MVCMCECVYVLMQFFLFVMSDFIMVWNLTKLNSDLVWFSLILKIVLDV